MNRPAGIRLDSTWRALQGAAYGVKPAAMTGRLQVCLPGDFDFGALDAVMGSLFDDPLPASVNAPSSADALALRLLHWHAAAQRQQKIPVFGASRIIEATETGEGRDYFVAVPCQARQATAKALAWVTDAINRVMAGFDPATQTGPVRAGFERLQELLRAHALSGLNNFHLVTAAHELDIPVQRLAGQTFCFGHGTHARRMNSTLTDGTSAIGVRIAQSKTESAEVLRRYGVPVPLHEMATDAEHATQIAARLGYPVVIKPDDQDQGRGVASGLRSEARVQAAFGAARKFSSRVLVEKHHDGQDYRLTVMRDQVIKILHRQAGGVTGDGVHTVGELLAQQQASPRFRKVLRQTGRRLIEADDEAAGLVADQRLSWDSIPEAGAFVVLRRKSNISAGGIQTLVPVQDAHPDNLDLAIQATQAVHLDLCGVDLLLPDIRRSWHETGAVVIEVNAMPQIGHNLAPEVYSLIVRELVRGDGRIPLHLVVCDGDPEHLGIDASLELMRAGNCNALSSVHGVWVDGRCRVHRVRHAFEAAHILLLNTQARRGMCILGAREIVDRGLPADRFEQVTVLQGQDGDAPALATCLAMLEGHSVQPILSRSAARP